MNDSERRDDSLERARTLKTLLQKADSAGSNDRSGMTAASIIDDIMRQLAHMVLEGDGGPRPGGISDAGHVAVTCELRGMVRGIRREILLDHAELAGKVADEIEKQAAAINLDELIAARVAEELRRAASTIDASIHHIVSGAIDHKSHEAASAAAGSIGRKVSRRLLDAAWPTATRSGKKGKRR